MSSPTLILHNSPPSPYAMKVRIALRERHIPFTTVNPSRLGMGGEPDAELLKANPRLEVPALVDTQEDCSVFDSTIILQYLEEKFPDKSLLPATPAGRARARMIEEVMDSSFEACTWGLAEVQWAHRAEGEQGEDLIRQAKAQLQTIFAWLEDQLGTSTYFNGDTFGHADLSVLPFLARSIYIEAGPSPSSPLIKWYEHVRTRASVEETLEEMISGVSFFAKAFAERFKPGTGNSREYRSDRLEWMIKSGGIDIVKKGIEEGTIRFAWPHPVPK